MKKVFALLSVLLVFMSMTFVACGNNAVNKGYEACVKNLQERLYVPSSLEIETAEAVEQADSVEIYYKIYYNSKNRLGSYVGYTYEYLCYDKETEKIRGLSETSYNIAEALTKADNSGYKYYKLK